MNFGGFEGGNKGLQEATQKRRKKFYLSFREMAKIDENGELRGRGEPGSQGYGRDTTLKFQGRKPTYEKDVVDNIIIPSSSTATATRRLKNLLARTLFTRAHIFFFCDAFRKMANRSKVGAETHSFFPSPLYDFFAVIFFSFFE